MTPKLRRGLRLAAGLVLALFLAAWLSLDGVDYRPYLREDYFTNAVARLSETAATNRMVRGELSAGFGQARLSPVVKAASDDPARGQFRALPLAGFGQRKGAPARGVHDDLYVKAVALKVGDRLGVMLGVDALIIPSAVTEGAMQRLTAELKLSRDQVYLSATHTHASLGGWGEGIVAEAFAGEFQPGVLVWFTEQLVVAVREALADLKPASFAHEQFEAPEFVRNRLVGNLGIVDPEFSFSVVRQHAGKTAILGSYSAHATVLPASIMEFSADYPGYWQRAVEQKTGGMALFLAGGVGSHSPVPGEGGLPGAQRMGEALAHRLLDRLPALALTNVVDFAVLGLEFPLPPLHLRVSDGVRLRPWLARELLPVKPTSYLQVFRIGPSVWVSTPCDFSGEMASVIKDRLRPKGIEAVITSFNGDYVGYVVPSRYYHLNGYEPRTMSFFGPNMPDYLEDLIRRMTGAVSSQPAETAQLGAR